MIIDHITPGCPILAKEEYTESHSSVCTQLHITICKQIQVQLHKAHWYEHAPNSVETRHKRNVTILWNQQVKTVIKKEAEKILKYKDLTTDI
jgi:hypothetical protein